MSTRASSRIAGRRVGAPVVSCPAGTAGPAFAFSSPTSGTDSSGFEATPLGLVEWATAQTVRDDAAAEIMVHLRRWSIDFSKVELYHALQANGVPAGIVATSEAISTTPRNCATGAFSSR